VVEAGFDGIPAARRAAALESNEDGWTTQLNAIEAHLVRGP